MSLSKVRLKILTKMAQAAGTTGTSGTTGTVGTTGATGTTSSTNTGAAVPPDPSPLASSLYPYIRAGFDSMRVSIIDSLCRMLSNAVNTTTNGKYNLQQLKDVNFQFDPSAFPSPDQKNLVVFFQKVYRTLLNNGQAFISPVSAPQIQRMVPFLLQSPELANLSQLSPTGQIAQHAPPGNFKDNIRELVARLQPTVATRRA